METSHTSDTEFGRSKLDLTLEPPPRGLAPLVLEGAVQGAKGRKQPIVLAMKLVKRINDQHGVITAF